jgi:hypothetical protein
VWPKDAVSFMGGVVFAPDDISEMLEPMVVSTVSSLFVLNIRCPE